MGGADRRAIHRPAVQRPEGSTAADLRCSPTSDRRTRSRCSGRRPRNLHALRSRSPIRRHRSGHQGPSGTYTPFVRARQFAAIAAATKARVDLGLRFVEAPNRTLVPAKAPGQSTHKIGLSSTADVNDEVGSLTAIAYQQNGR
ncbi:DUF5655 domain-containing protein [Rhodococcus sp. 3Y1]